MDLIPVTVLTGYLGAGKTTLLNRILRDEQRLHLLHRAGRPDPHRRRLMKRSGRLDGIVAETTGLANPAPIAQTFFVDDEVRQRARIDAIVTVVDAHHFLGSLDSSDPVEEKLAFADVILLNEIDIVSAEQLATVKRRIRAINAFAPIHHTVHARSSCRPGWIAGHSTSSAS